MDCVFNRILKHQ